MAPRSRLSSALTTASLAVVAASVAAVARRWLDRDAARDAPGDGGTESGTTPPTDAAVDRVDAVIVEEKLRAYREIMREVVALNREAVTLDPERFRHEADAIAFDQDRESALKEHYLDVNQTYESYLYVIDEAVREAASDYVGYLATYQDDGAHAGALLYRAGEVYEAMRADLGLESLFDEESATPPDVDSGGSIMPDPDADVPEVEDFTETLGSVEDLDFFNAGKRRGAEAAESDETDDADEADDADAAGTGSSGDAGAETDADADDAGTGSGDDAGSATDERSRS